MPFGGKYQLTPSDGMAAKVPVLGGETNTATVMTFGYNPKLSSWSQYHGSTYAIVESVSKAVALGADYKKIYLTFQEYFERLGTDPKRWGKPFASLLGAYKTQLALGIAAIGGKDSMSGSFNDLDVPPTLTSFAVAPVKADKVISQEIKKAGSKLVLPDSNWVLTDDDMTVELHFVKGIQGLEVQRTTKYSDYQFTEIEPRLFRLKGNVIKEANMLAKSDEYWAKVRQVPLTKKESTMDVFMNRIEQIPGFKYVIFGAKALIENFVETGGKKHPSKFDFGPINTMITSNYVNGTRFRLSGMTTGNLDPHWSLSGYGAYGTKDKKWFYSGQVAYSFNKREYVLWEFPKHYIAFKYTYDVMSPMDKYLATDKDNLFVGWKWTTVDQMSYMRDATLTYELETNTGFSVQAMARHRNDQPAGQLQYWKNNGGTPGQWDEKNTLVHDITTTELGVTLRYAPGETFVNTKQRRVPVSLDAPTFTLSHTAGFKGVLGGEYNFNLTEASIRKRFWLGSWGKLDVTARAGAQWNTVPFPLLNLPMANLSYITQNNESFNLINNMEFLNDRYASLNLSYDMNGKLFNRIPLIKKLKWREMFRIRGLWGTLTDKNNPYKSNNPDLFLFPMRDGVPTSHVMGKTPYVEASVGIYNIFKLLHIEYVRRLTYTDIPGVKKGGIRFMILMIF